MAECRTLSPPMTAADLARIYGVSIRTIRRWAARDKWRRQPGRPVIYYLADVEKTMRRRDSERLGRLLGR